jgi:hypothetical protein
MSEQTNRAIVVSWLAALAIRCAPKRSEDVELIIRTYAAPIAQDVPARVFGDDCLEFVSRQFEHFPGYAALRKQLDVWQGRNPERRAVPAPGIEMPAADRVMVGCWQRYRANEAVLPRGVSLESWLSTCRKPCPHAFRYITDTDLVAAEIALKHGWRRDPQPPPSEAEMASVHDQITQTLAEMRPAREFMPPSRATIATDPGVQPAPINPHYPDDATLLAIYREDFKRTGSAAAHCQIAHLEAKIAEAKRVLAKTGDTS